ncbi:hypothetical protein [Nocardia arthritidis]|uniref:DUF8020 domain-containing protein n=1 Tax=Nocardia arthritidis TaxID=228602 RepID=A0A6G9YRD5_9NOCA|nr:hypothetical protein [Nocardia arthritidis]QIS15657.1 hypothetical protein F5544_39180 [Nocardia arthritidis]
MRKFSSYAAGAAVALGALNITTPESTAVPPQQNSSTEAPGIHWTANVVDKSIVVKTDAGTLFAKDGQFDVLDADGHVAAGMPLSYRLDDKVFPIAAEIDGHTAILTPGTDPATATQAPSPALKPIDAQADFDAALSAAGTQFGLATGVGSLVGTIIGGGVGCVAGAVVGAVLMPPIFLPGAVGGCLAGIVAGVALGAAAGTIVLGVPVGIASAIQFFQRLNTPPAAPAQS